MPREAVVITEWDDVPLTLTLRDVAALYGLSPNSVRDKVEAADPSLPRPAFLGPYRWRKADVRQHYDTASISDQRASRARRRAQRARERLAVVR